MTDILNKTAFVTGAASGIGLAITKALLAGGARVMMADIDGEKLADAAKDVGHADKVAHVTCDVADYASVQAAAQATTEKFGHVHLVFNNAGVALAGISGAIPVKDWRWIVDINLMGVVHGVEVFLPLIKGHGEGGHIINTASMAGHVATGYMAPYHATKFAVVGYSEGLKAELQNTGINVSVLCPSWIQSNIYNTQQERPSVQGAPRQDLSQSTVYQSTKALIDNAMSADIYAALVLKSISQNRFYVFSDPDSRAMIDVRREAILADYDGCLVDLG